MGSFNTVPSNPEVLMGVIFRLSTHLYESPLLAGVAEWLLVLAQPEGMQCNAPLKRYLNASTCVHEQWVRGLVSASALHLTFQTAPQEHSMAPYCFLQTRLSVPSYLSCNK